MATRDLEVSLDLPVISNEGVWAGIPAVL